ncbi:hypothetical protein KKG90_11555 [Candidatus Bipolaricaulota bacterium]|nr:hypothetical protein [Candidatus Bipolaricaulota bacterium]
MRRRGISIDYDELISPRPFLIYNELAAHLADQLPERWVKAYRKMAQSPTSIHAFSQHGFHFLFDRASELCSKGVVSGDRAIEDRIIVAYGQSTNLSNSQNPGSRGHLLGSAGSQFGEQAERSYLRGSVLGGWFDISLYPLYRDLDHERSSDCRDYRAMKRYCSEHAGTFCFTRLIYDSRSWNPSAIEHGLLRTDGTFWIRVFRNKTTEARIPLRLGPIRTTRRPSSETTLAD